jgi:hypothetical protein
MDHDMSDPKVARAMELDMRRRFFTALVLAVPIAAGGESRGVNE